jgi:hypothetical protein
LSTIVSKSRSSPGRIVDPQLRQVTVRTIQEEREQPAWSQRTFAGDEIIGSASLPEFQVIVSQLWIGVESEEDETAGAD